LAMSRYLPKEDEVSALFHPSAAYQIQAVGGWADSPGDMRHRRRSVNFIVEGSILGPLPSAIPGQIVDIRPTYGNNPDPLKHPVYRSGLALAVGMKGAAA
jgi:hypothetical protein